MSIERNDSDERQARLDMMIAEFRAAQQRRIVKRDIVMQKRVESDRRATARLRPLPVDTAH